MKISQTLYIERVLGKKLWTNLKGVGSPLNTNIKYNTKSLLLENEDKNEFLEVVGSA